MAFYTWHPINSGSSAFFPTETAHQKSFGSCLSSSLHCEHEDLSWFAVHTICTKDIFPSLVCNPDVNEFLLVWLCFLSPIMVLDI